MDIPAYCHHQQGEEARDGCDFTMSHHCQEHQKCTNLCMLLIAEYTPTYPGMEWW